MLVEKSVLDRAWLITNWRRLRQYVCQVVILVLMESSFFLVYFELTTAHRSWDMQRPALQRYTKTLACCEGKNSPNINASN